MSKTSFGGTHLKIWFFWRRKSQIQTFFNSEPHSSHNENKGVETSVPKFWAILPWFSEILANPCNQHCCQNWSWDRDQVSRLHCNSGYQILVPNKISWK